MLRESSQRVATLRSMFNQASPAIGEANSRVIVPNQILAEKSIESNFEQGHDSEGFLPEAEQENDDIEEEELPDAPRHVENAVEERQETAEQEEAIENIEASETKKMKKADLVAELKKRGLSTNGLKEEAMNRLIKAIEDRAPNVRNQAQQQNASVQKNGLMKALL